MGSRDFTDCSVTASVLTYLLTETKKIGTWVTFIKGIVLKHNLRIVDYSY